MGVFFVIALLVYITILGVATCPRGPSLFDMCRAAGICVVQFWLALTGLTAAALRGAGLGRLVDQRKPLFLPPWTGRERESLQQDLDAAAKDFIGLPDMTWAEHKKRWPSLTPTVTDLEISQGHGLFPEALEAYLESQE